MEELIRLIDFLTPYGTHSYVFMLGILLACGFGLPLPEDIVLISGGVLAARGVTHLGPTNIICLLGVLIGDASIFIIGRTLGAAVKSKWIFRHIFSPERDIKVKDVIHRYGAKVVFLARFMPGLRMPVYLTCGIFHIPFWKFLLLDGFASLISVPLWIYFGYLFGLNLEAMADKLAHIHQGMRIALYAFIGIAVIIIYIFRLRSKANSALKTT